MYNEQVQKNNIIKLYKQLDAQLKQFKKRGVSFSIQCHSLDLANIQLRVTGKYGSVEKQVVLLNRDESKFGWEIYYSYNKTYNKGYLESFSELPVVINKVVNTLGQLVNKI